MSRFDLFKVFSQILKDYISYEIFKAAGVNAPLTSYVKIKVNGEDLGLYLAIEDVDSSYLDRTENGEGELYKPETEMLNKIDQAPGDRGDKKDFDPTQMGGFDRSSQNPDQNNSQDSSSPAQSQDMKTSPDQRQGNRPFMPGRENLQLGQNSSGEQKPDNMPENFCLEDAQKFFEQNGGGECGLDNMPGGFNMFGGGANGADLKYTDDDLLSYTDIFDNAETKVTEEDEHRVVDALKNLSDNNVEVAVDTDEVIRYFAAHYE